MRNLSAEGSERFLLSVFCIDGEHDECPHMHGVECGGNPLRRSKSRALPCKCECHSSCPVASKKRTVPVQAWRESCTCPAAEDRRTRLDRVTDSSEDTAQAWQYPPARREAFNMFRDQAAGTSWDQVKDLYKAELRARGLDMPPEAQVDVDVSLMTRDYPHAPGLLGRSLAGLVKLLGGAGRRRAD